MTWPDSNHPTYEGPAPGSILALHGVHGVAFWPFDPSQMSHEGSTTIQMDNNPNVCSNLVGIPTIHYHCVSMFICFHVKYIPIVSPIFYAGWVLLADKTSTLFQASGQREFGVRGGKSAPAVGLFTCCEDPLPKKALLHTRFSKNRKEEMDHQWPF